MDRDNQHRVSVIMVLAVGLSVFVTAWFGIALSRGTDYIAAIWFSNAVLLASLLKNPKGHWLALIVSAGIGNSLANILSGNSAVLSVILSLINLTEVLVCAGLFTLTTKERDFRRPKPMFLLSAISIAPATIVSSVLAAVTIQQAFGEEFTSVFLNWYAADTLGLITITPILLVLDRTDFEDLLHPTQIRGSASVLALLTVTYAIVFAQTTLPLLFLPFPAIVVATFALGFVGASLTVAFTAIIGLWATVNGFGPTSLISGPLQHKIYVLQLFTATASLTSFAIASMLKERKILKAALAQAPDYHYIKNLNCEIISANMNVAREVGLPIDSLVGKTDFDLTSEDRASVLVAEEMAIMQTGLALENKIERVESDETGVRWFETSKVPLKNDAGRIIGMSGMTRDVTSRKKLEAAFEQERNRLSVILAEMSDGLAVVDHQGQVVFCNEKFRAFFPVTGRYIEPGSNLVSILALSSESGEWPGIHPQELVYQIRNGFEGEFQLPGKVWLHLRSTVGNGGSVTLVLRDVSPMKKAYTDLQEMAERLEVLADVDGLTGLYNRRYLDRRLINELASCRANSRPVSLVLCDVDRFKQFNDIYGHQAGDECLRRVADVLKSCTRRSSDIVARYGGEEICILLPDTGEASAGMVADHLRSVVANLALPHDGSEKRVVTISAGVATIEPEMLSDKPEDLIERADLALYEAKRAGRDLVIVHSQLSAPQDDLVTGQSAIIHASRA